MLLLDAIPLLEADTVGYTYDSNYYGHDCESHTVHCFLTDYNSGCTQLLGKNIFDRCITLSEMFFSFCPFLTDNGTVYCVIMFILTSFPSLVLMLTLFGTDIS